MSGYDWEPDYDDAAERAREWDRADNDRWAEQEARDRLDRDVGERLPAAPALPVRPVQSAEEDVAERVVGEGKAGAATVSDGVVGSGLDNLSATHELRPLHSADGDLDPVSHVELHHPVVTSPPALSYGDVRCGICGWTTGCECESRAVCGACMGEPLAYYGTCAACGGTGLDVGENRETRMPMVDGRPIVPPTMHEGEA